MSKNDIDTIDKSINKLNEEFKRIKKLGYVPEVHSGYGGIGDTFPEFVTCCIKIRLQVLKILDFFNKKTLASNIV